MSVSGGN